MKSLVGAAMAFGLFLAVVLPAHARWVIVPVKEWYQYGSLHGVGHVTYRGSTPESAQSQAWTFTPPQPPGPIQLIECTPLSPISATCTGFRQGQEGLFNGTPSSLCPDGIGILYRGSVPYCSYWDGRDFDNFKHNGPQCPECGNPIDPASGNKFQQEVDIEASGPSGLRFARAYNSWYMTPSTSVGRNWRHSYDMRLLDRRAGANEMHAHRASGKVLVFRLSGGAWTPDGDVAERLSDLGGGTAWKLTTADDESEYYDAAGKPTAIVDRLGRTTALVYSDGTAGGTNGDSYEGTTQALRKGLLIRVEGPFGRTLRLKYKAPVATEQGGSIVTEPGDLVSRVIAPDAGEYAYSYDGEGRLVSVLYPDASGGRTRTYHYNEAAHVSQSFPYALTGISDDGVRFATYKYIAGGGHQGIGARAFSTEHAGGADRHVVTYQSNGTATVVDPVGTTRTYAFSAVQLTRRNTALVQPCSSCAGGTATEARTYDSLGNLASRKDFNGHLTCYGYDTARKLETARTEGLSGSGTCAAPVTTPATRRVTTEWHSQWRLRKRVAEPLRVTTYAYHGDAGVSCAPAGASTAIVCSTSVQATTDATGMSGFAAVPDGVPRVWTYAYNLEGQVTLADGPRSDVADTTARTYHVADDPSGNFRRGDLAMVTNAKGHATTFTHYDGAGRPRRIVDPNGLETVLEYWPRGWLKSRSVGTAAAGHELTTYD